MKRNATSKTAARPRVTSVPTTLSTTARVLIAAEPEGTPDGFRVDVDGNSWCGWGMGQADLDGVKVFNPRSDLLPCRALRQCLLRWPQAQSAVHGCEPCRPLGVTGGGDHHAERRLLPRQADVMHLHLVNILKDRMGATHMTLFIPASRTGRAASAPTSSENGRGRIR
jgi:hypothetical protein